MKQLNAIILVAATAFLVACGSSPTEKKDIAEARLTEEKTKTIQEYKACVKKAKEDTAKLDACERLLKAVDTGSAPATAN